MRYSVHFSAYSAWVHSASSALKSRGTSLEKSKSNPNEWGKRFGFFCVLCVFLLCPPCFKSQGTPVESSNEIGFETRQSTLK